MSSHLLQAINLTKRYAISSHENASQEDDAVKVYALRGSTFHLEPGELVALVGPSGCGKSTLLNIIGLADAPTSGDVLFRGTRVDFLNEAQLLQLRRTMIGYVFQQFNLLPTLSAVENIMLGPLLVGAPVAAATATAVRLLGEVGLAHRRNHRPSQLSGGEMQRVALCRALAHQPKLLLADEPTGNLDSSAGEQVLTLLRVAADTGTAVIMATHSEHAVAWCHRTLRMRDGVLVEQVP